MERVEKSLAGVNMAQMHLSESTMHLNYKEKSVLQVSLSSIVNSSVINKNDINLELALPEQQEGDIISCIRFYVPPLSEKCSSLDEEKKEGVSNDNEQSQSSEHLQEQAKKLNNMIIKRANIRNVSGDSLVTISEVPLQVPRGRYTVDIYESFIKFHGSTFNYKIEAKHIERAFLLPKPDDTHMVFVLALKQSVRQGNTTYPYILMQFKKDQQQQVHLKLPKEDYAKYDESLCSSYDGPLYDTFTKLFKILVQTNIIIPGNFKSSSGHSAVRCSIRANEGYLFFLQKSLIFINKPIIYLKVEEIEMAEFHRTSQSVSKFFDLTLKRKGRQMTDILLFGLDKQDKSQIIGYFKSRSTKIVIIEEEVMARPTLEDSEDDINQNRQEGEDSHLDEDSEDDESFRADDKISNSQDSDDDQFQEDSD